MYMKDKLSRDITIILEHKQCISYYFIKSLILTIEFSGPYHKKQVVNLFSERRNYVIVTLISSKSLFLV